MIDPFGQWIVFQEQAVEIQRQQYAAMRQGLQAAGELARTQQALGDVAKANATLWKSWFSLWGVK